MEPLSFTELPPDEMRRRAQEFYEEIKTRRTVREFSDRPVPYDIIESCIKAAGTAPNGANLQPWTFVAIGDPVLKSRIREAAEAEEREFYTRRATSEWLDDLAPLGTDASKPFLETAPWLIAVFAQSWGVKPDGTRKRHYYVKESVGIACGFLIAALHHAGLATLTHTPSPMEFLSQILGRPGNEKPFLLLVTGFPAEDASVPAISKKSADAFIIRR
jgi:iodotyrosine deiodinase